MERIRVIDVFWIVLIGGLIFSVILAIPGIVLLTKTTEIQRGRTKIGENKDWLVNDLKNVNHSIYILSGELHPKIFDDPQVLSEIENAVKRGVEVKVIAGPEILVKEGKPLELKSKPLLELVVSGDISLWVPPKRNHLRHFTLLDSNYYLEEPHPKAAPERDYEYGENSVYGTAKLRKYFVDMQKGATKINNNINDKLYFSELNPAK